MSIEHDYLFRARVFFFFLGIMHFRYHFDACIRYEGEKGTLYRLIIRYSFSMAEIECMVDVTMKAS